MTQKDIIIDYQQTKNMKKTAQNMRVSYQVVKKVLITAGLYTSPIIERIRELTALGMDTKKIAEMLDMTTSGVYANMPYTRPDHFTESRTKNAIKIARWRERKKQKETQN